MFHGDMCLIPAVEVPFDINKEHQDLSASEKATVLYEAFQASMIHDKLEFGDFRTVSEESIEKHENWQAKMTRLR
jgi:hypothetical protein